MKASEIKNKIDEGKRFISKRLSSPKYKHSLGVARVSRALAEKHGADPDKAYLAGLLHDVGRIMSVASYPEYIKKNRISLSPFKGFFTKNPFLLHGIIGRHIARIRFGVKDRDVLESISGHTVAKRFMSKFEKIIYVADMIAPDRRFRWVGELRSKAFRNIDKALASAVELKIIQVIKKKKQIFPETVLVWNELLEEN